MKTPGREIILEIGLCCALAFAGIARAVVLPTAQQFVVPSDMPKASTPQIDRRALVGRHNITLKAPDPLTPLTVGNGEFAFTADITGLQTFSQYHRRGMALGTQAQWGWHTMPNPNEYRLADVLEEYMVAGRAVPYASGQDKSRTYSPAASWLRANPHRLHLGQVGLRISKTDNSSASIDDLTDTVQTLDLWTGLLTSQFKVDGQGVTVLTVCHPSRDVMVVRVESPLLRKERLLVTLTFPHGSQDWGSAADWSHPDRHITRHRVASNRADLTRILDNDRYYVSAVWSSPGVFRVASEHNYEIGSGNGTDLEIVFAFSPKQSAEPMPDFETVRAEAGRHWG
ncbi:MAG: hypothetical protein JSW66_16440, partial [Phycisphaerales bacterium]